MQTYSKLATKTLQKGIKSKFNSQSAEPQQRYTVF